MCSKWLSKYRTIAQNTFLGIVGLPECRGSLQEYNDSLSTSILPQKQSWSRGFLK